MRKMTRIHAEIYPNVTGEYWICGLLRGDDKNTYERNFDTKEQAIAWAKTVVKDD